MFFNDGILEGLQTEVYLKRFNAAYEKFKNKDPEVIKRFISMYGPPKKGVLNKVIYYFDLEKKDKISAAKMALVKQGELENIASYASI